MYEEYRLCPELKAKEKCFRVQKYDQGNMVEIFHEHVPSHRISLDSEIEALRSLIAKFSDWSAVAILHSHLNQRKGGPSLEPSFISHVAYPEKGALRRYFSARDITAWSDTVISKTNFRSQESSQNGA